MIRTIVEDLSPAPVTQTDLRARSLRLALREDRGQGKIFKSWGLPLRAILLLGVVSVALLAGPGSAPAQQSDEQYIHILTVVQQADAMNTNGSPAALKKYIEAQRALQNFQRTNAMWNTQVVAFRMKYLNDKVAALSGQDPNATASQSTTSSVRSTGAATGTSSASSSSGAGANAVKLLAAGNEPRQQLRLHPAVGTKQGCAMSLKMAMETKMGEMQAPAVKIPLMTFDVDIEVKSVSPSGDISYTMVINNAGVVDDPSTSPQVAEAMKSSLKNVNGLAGTCVVSSRSISKSVDFKAPAGADPQVRMTMDQMKESFSHASAPLPEEAVGVGAKWQHRASIKSQGMTIDQTATYELVSIEGDRISAKTTVTQSAANQKITNPAMGGMTVDLGKLATTGSGSLTCDLSQVIPGEAAVDSHSVMDMSMNNGGQKQSITMTIDMAMKLAPK